MHAHKPVPAARPDPRFPKGAPPRPPAWAPAHTVPAPHRVEGAEGVEPEYLGTD